LTSTFGAIVVDLNVSGMPNNRTPARRIAGAGMAELRRQIDDKTRWRGTRHGKTAPRVANIV
jgi:putative transposase